ncbi:hypothetical protein ACLK1S_10225 [Escherichia coli]
MLKLFSAFRKNKIWDFNGGIHPPEMKTHPTVHFPPPGTTGAAFCYSAEQQPIGAEGESALHRRR